MIRFRAFLTEKVEKVLGTEELRRKLLRNLKKGILSMIRDLSLPQ
jgi:hypothetical protein